MAVAALFYIASVNLRANGQSDPSADVVLQPVVRGEEGKKWSKYTPSGKIELTSLNSVATEWFKDRLGKDVSILFDDPAV